MIAYLKNILFWIIAAFTLAFLVWGVAALTWKLFFQAIMIGTVNYFIFNKPVRKKIAMFLLGRKPVSNR
jgi:hypothetical protein